jgi:hypothetical protein
MEDQSLFDDKSGSDVYRGGDRRIEVDPAYLDNAYGELALFDYPILLG